MKNKKDLWDTMWDLIGMMLTGLVVLVLLDIVLTCVGSVF